MASTAEDVVRRIAAECTFIDGPGAVGIRLKPAAVIVEAIIEDVRFAEDSPLEEGVSSEPVSESGICR
jgi:hypothetical protein